MQAKPCNTLRERWEERAQANPMFYINADRQDWTAPAFFASGETDVATFLDPFCRENRFVSSTATAAEIGCGMGRLTQALARRFAQVHGFDISPVMIKKARAALPAEIRNVDYHVTDGCSLAPLPNAGVDLVFSYIVLQHVPTREIVAGYLAEAFRVLKPGGLALLQVNGLVRSLRERICCKIVPSDKVPLIHRRLKLKIAPHSTMGIVFTETQIRHLVGQSGLKVTALTGVGAQYMWLHLRKP